MIMIMEMKIIKVKVIFQIVSLIKEMTEVNRNHRITAKLIRKKNQSQRVSSQNKKEIHTK